MNVEKVARNPCKCLECVEKDEFGEPAKFYTVRKGYDAASDDFIASAVPGSEHTRTYRAKHWICDTCGNSHRWPPQAGGRVPASTRTLNGKNSTERIPWYWCGDCIQSGALPRQMANEDSGGAQPITAAR